MKRRTVLAACALLVAATPFDPFGEARIDDKPGAQVPLDLGFVDQAGRQTTLRRIAAGQPLLLAPVLHNCPNVCGVTLAGLTGALAAKPHERVAVVAFGIDPADTPADAAHDQTRNPRLGATYLVGTAPAVHQVTDALGYRYAYDPRIRQFAHVAAVAVLTPDGRLVRWINGLAPEPADIASALADARGERTNAFVRALAVLCYHYDPETGRYSLAIMRILEAAGVLTVLAIGGGIAFLARREA